MFKPTNKTAYHQLAYTLAMSTTMISYELIIIKLFKLPKDKVIHFYQI